jgi:hypothetical protein
VDEAVAALIGAFIGAAGPIALSLFQEKRHDARRAQQTALAVAGEIRAVMEIVRKRDYIAGIRYVEELARGGEIVPFKVRVTHNYFPVVERSLENLGILPDGLSSLIPRFLTLAKSALEDISAIEQGVWNDRKPQEWFDGYQDLADVLESAMAAGTEIVAIVESRYPE